VTSVYVGLPGSNMCGAPPMPAGVRLVSGFVRAVKPGGCCAGGGCCWSNATYVPATRQKRATGRPMRL